MSDSMIADAARRIFHDLADPQTVTNAADDTWRDPLWSALADSGLAAAWVPDALGGAGAGLADGFEVLRIAGAFALAEPLAETLMAGWLLSTADIVLPAGRLAMAPVHRGDQIDIDGGGVVSGRARAVPFAAQADAIVVLGHHEDGFAVAVCDPPHCTIVPGTSIAGDGADDVEFAGTALECRPAPEGIDDAALMLMGATVRSQQMAGALQAMLDLSVDYAKERIAFGKPISQFQAVQHNLARLAGEAAAAVAVATAAADSFDRLGPDDAHTFLDVASAKIRVGEAGGEGAAIAHQVHGAIGFTAEHVLHRFAQRVWAWRDEFGNEASWAAALGRQVAAAGADALWPTLTAGEG